MTERDSGAEKAVYGAGWARLHGGYFSCPEVAQALLEPVWEACCEKAPDTIVDLGGGTGFLLGRLKAMGLSRATALVVLDGAPAQLAVAREEGLATVCAAVEDFRRGDLAAADGSVLFLMRSVLHYFGEAGLTAVLAHLREQARSGELWIHQTACFERGEDAGCLNTLYRRMRTRKWYPTVSRLQAQLAAAGWDVAACRPAPRLHLEAGGLGRRYALDEADLRAIRADMAEEFGEQTPVFHVTSAGFEAELHYRILICRAAGVG